MDRCIDACQRDWLGIAMISIFLMMAFVYIFAALLIVSFGPFYNYWSQVAKAWETTALHKRNLQTMIAAKQKRIARTHQVITAVTDTFDPRLSRTPHHPALGIARIVLEYDHPVRAADSI
jgi:hypothetical protein